MSSIFIISPSRLPVLSLIWMISNSLNGDVCFFLQECRDIPTFNSPHNIINTYQYYFCYLSFGLLLLAIFSIVSLLFFTLVCLLLDFTSWFVFISVVPVYELGPFPFGSPCISLPFLLLWHWVSFFGLFFMIFYNCNFG